jgi:hypothetical protein
MLNKFIERPIDINCFLIELQLNINKVKDKLINDIEKGILDEDNMNHKTNVTGKMTSWKYFNNNLNFHNLLDIGFNEIKKYIKLKPSFLHDSWGIKINKNDYTAYHNHFDMTYSGILYLNNFEEPINFPQYNLSITPKEGTFLFFSGLLEHGVDKNTKDTVKYAIPFNILKNKPWNN